MREVVASLVDVLAVGSLAFGGFRLALFSSPCRGDLADCFPLAPLVVLAVIVCPALYFGLGYALWRSTPGRRLAGVRPRQGEPDDAL